MVRRRSAVGPSGSGRSAAGAAQVEGQDQAADLALGFGDLLHPHRLEIHLLQLFLVGHGQHRVGDRGLLLLPALLLLRGREGLGDAAGGGRGAVLLLLLLRLQQRHRHGLFGGGGVAPEQGEGVVEHLLVLPPVHHHAAQGGAHVRAAADIDQRQGLLAGQRLGRADRQPGPPQQAGEVHHIGGEGRALLCHRHQRNA